MAKDPTESRLRELITEFSKKDAAKLPAGEDLLEFLGFDSLSGLRMLATIEKGFSIRFPDEELSELRNIEKLVQAIKQSKAAQ